MPHRRRHIPYGIKAAIGRCKFRCSAYNGAAHRSDHLLEAFCPRRHCISRDRFELVHRAARVRETAACNHGYEHPTSSRCGSENQRNRISYPTCAVLVRYRSTQPRRVPAQHLARVAHGQGEDHRFGCGKATEQRSHGEGGDLGIGDGTVGDAGDEGADGVWRQGLPVALAADEFRYEHGNGVG